MAQWPPASNCRISVGTCSIRVDASTWRYQANNATGRKRFSWGGAVRGSDAQRLNAWEEACRFVQAEPHADHTKEAARAAMAARDIRTLSEALVVGEAEANVGQMHEDEVEAIVPIHEAGLPDDVVVHPDYTRLKRTIKKHKKKQNNSAV